jgi:L-lactate dehydrogenase complex protein LldF
MHLVLLDNGRSKIHQNNDMQETLKCIRCGSCINHCPVYTQLGGHAYGTVYPGPIGITLEPQKQGITELGELTSLCTMCGACGEVCPVQIPLPKLINKLRSEAVEGNNTSELIEGARSKRKPLESFAWKIWKQVYSNPFIYSIFSKIATRLNFISPKKLGQWGKYRITPRPSKQSLKELANQAGFDHE